MNLWAKKAEAPMLASLYNWRQTVFKLFRAFGVFLRVFMAFGTPCGHAQRSRAEAVRGGTITASVLRVALDREMVICLSSAFPMVRLCPFVLSKIDCGLREKQSQV